jgi:endogenous inhibitor of DNA gyrase (YacG/DUF329 family)
MIFSSAEPDMLCPTCQNPVSAPAEDQPLPKWFPFCSERCKLIDLGRWLDGKYQIDVVDPEEGSAPSRDPLITD